MRFVAVLGIAVAAVVFATIHLISHSAPATHQESPAFETMLARAIGHLEEAAERATEQVSEASVGVARAEIAQPTSEPVTACPAPTCGLTAIGGNVTCTPWDFTCWDSELETCSHDDPACTPDEVTYSGAYVTCDHTEFTCEASHTCKADYTCDSRHTCNGQYLCDGVLTAWMSTCTDTTMTYDLETPTCLAECPKYTYSGAEYTCDFQMPTCYETCGRWPTCNEVFNPECKETSVAPWPGGSDRTTWGKVKREFSE